MPPRRKPRRKIVAYASELITGRAARRAARHDLRNGRVPPPRRATGKFWTD